MKLVKNIFVASLVVVAVSSCRKEDALNLEDIPGLGGDTWVKGPIDKWIYDSLTVPFNIAAKYKWDQSELEQDKTLVPPKEESVIPVLGSIKKAWINTYIAEAGVPFFKLISPKFLVLVGSGSYNRGSITLGTAEGGRKVVLYQINSFRVKGMPGYVPADTTTVIEMFHVIQHEFAHILDQNVKVPVSFGGPSANSYTSDWLNVTPTEAKNEGFITQYAISGKDDDWAEMVSIMLVYGKAYFDNYVNSITYTTPTANGTTSTQARNRLRQKEASVVTYFKQAWNIDFYSLQNRTKTAINALLY